MTRDKLRDIFQSPFSYENWQSVLMSLFSGAGKKCQFSPESSPQQMPVADDEKMDGFYLGEVRFGIESMKLYTFHIKDNTTNISRNRVGLRNTVNYLRDVNDAAIVVYYNDHQWRVSYICDIISSLKRFTFVFGDKQTLYTTPIKRFENLGLNDISLDAILETFSVEALSKDFFTSYKSKYDKFCSHIGGNVKSNRDYVKKMMGRLVFLQFLQKKGWMNGDYNYMQNLFANSPYQDDFLEEVLEPLFFHVLNTKESERNHPKLKNLGDKINIPYLNGGLFEADENDKKKVPFDAKLFADLFDFFSHYNFTIDENDPNDAEVGIDPEMLGHIFENLLEDNKDKGAFYTPKEIVRYMCRESLVQYLKTHVDDQLHDDIEQLINRHFVSRQLQNRDTARLVDTLLKNVKICDPAIGSGAFPMGLLNETFTIRKLLYGFLGYTTDFNNAETKKEIIQNNIYGVDIEQGAVDIARLRFWLSLVVDEDVPQPLPNLDYKIMQGNSLLESFENVDLSQFNEQSTELDLFGTDETKSEIKKLIKDYFAVTDHERKDILRVEIDEKVKEHIVRSCGQCPEIIEKVEAIDLTNRPFFLWHVYFADVFEQGGFDIVIGNPPYLRIQGIRDTNPAFAEELVKKYKSATGSFDLYATFAERGLQIINRSGVVNYIMPVKWTNAAFGKGLRGVMAENSSASKIINFGAYQAFNASTYTGLQWFKPDSNEMQYYELDRNLETNQELGRYLGSLNSSNAAKIKADKLNKDAWVLTVGQTTEILHKLELHPRRISDIFDKIFQGLATSKDDVYFLYKCREESGCVIGHSKYLEREVKIERGLVKPLLKGEDVHRYDNISTDRFVVFPYILSDGKANLYAEQQLSELFPMGYAYLKECENVLRGREKGRFDIDGEWFQFGRKQGILSAETEKLVAPDISLGGNFAYDEKGEFYQTTTIYGYIKKTQIKESYKCLAAILNSRLCWWFLVNTGTTLANGYFRFKPDYINPFSVPAEIPAKVDETISNLVNKILEAKKLDSKADISALEREIDTMVYALYNLTEEEIKIIEK